MREKADKRLKKFIEVPPMRRTALEEPEMKNYRKKRLKYRVFQLTATTERGLKGTVKRELAKRQHEV